MRRHRNAKVVATLGPGSASEDIIRSLFLAGVDVFRLNFSHGSHDAHRERLQQIRNVERSVGRPIGVLADMQSCVWAPSLPAPSRWSRARRSASTSRTHRATPPALTCLVRKSSRPAHIGRQRPLPILRSAACARRAPHRLSHRHPQGLTVPQHVVAARLSRAERYRDQPKAPRYRMVPRPSAKRAETGPVHRRVRRHLWTNVTAGYFPRGWQSARTQCWGAHRRGRPPARVAHQ